MPEHGIDVEIEHAVPGIGIAVDHLAADIGAGIGMEDVELRPPSRRIPASCAATLDGSVRSTTSGTARGRDPQQRSFSRSSARSMSTTRAPAARKVLAHSRPMPDAAPVIAAIFPASALTHSAGPFLSLEVQARPCARLRPARQRVHDHGDREHARR